MTPDVKRCLDCGEIKPRTDFHKAGRGVQGCCKTCHSVRNAAWRAANPERHRLAYVKGHVRRKYGLTWDDYLAMYEKQQGCCALCPKWFDLLAIPGLVVDHDHETGRVRGLLCMGHNSALGAFGDDVEGLQRAIEYVRGD